jgi:hypothetical protein
VAVTVVTHRDPPGKTEPLDLGVTRGHHKIMQLLPEMKVKLGSVMVALGLHPSVLHFGVKSDCGFGDPRFLMLEMRWSLGPPILHLETQVS